MRLREWFCVDGTRARQFDSDYSGGMVLHFFSFQVSPLLHGCCSVGKKGYC